MTAILSDLIPEYAGPGVGVTDTCGLCRKPFDLMYPPAQYPSVTVEGEMPELICDTCQDEAEADREKAEISEHMRHYSTRSAINKYGMVRVLAAIDFEH